MRNDERAGTRPLRNASKRRRGRRILTGGGLAAVVFLAAPEARAQTDYYNLDAGRPVRIEDAFPVERYAFELQLAPFRLERGRGGLYRYEVEPELAYGLLPNLQVELGLPFAGTESGVAGPGLALAGIHASALYNLNTETLSLPALALAVDVAVPAGGYGPDRMYTTLRGLATRTFRFGRLHVNGGYTIGATPTAEDETGEVSRWLAGVAVDRTFPLQGFLLVTDVWARQPLHDDEGVEWTAGFGVRYQLNPRLALDVGVGKQLNGGDEPWYFTFGSAYAFALRSLMPIR